MNMNVSMSVRMSFLMRCLLALVIGFSIGLSVPAATDAQAQGFFERLFGKKKRADKKPPPEELRRVRPREPRTFKPIVPHILLAGGKVFPITVIGDSLAANLYTGITKQLRGHQNVILTKTIRADAGLVKEERYNMRGEVKDKLAKATPRVAVIMSGINDRQRFPPQAFKGKKPAKPPVFSSAVWQETYSGRIDQLLQSLRNRNVMVYWVGLPIVRDRAHAQDNAYLNDVIRERVELAGGKYIDIWEAFASETGAFTRLGPDLKGVNRRLRTKDGIHFTTAGTQKLAHFAVKEILADFGTSTLNPTHTPGLVAGANTRGQPGLIVKPLTTTTSDLLAYDSGVNRRLTVPARPQIPAYVRALEWGDALPAVKGRADDFSWPRR